MLEVAIITCLSVVVAMALPGPSLVAVVSAALSQGRGPAFIVAGGISAGILSWAALMVCGLGTMLRLYPVLLVVLKIIGGGYLVWLSIASFGTAWRGTLTNFDAIRRQANPWAHFRYGMVIVLTNPTAALMWAAVVSFLFGFGLSKWQVAALSPAFSLAAFFVYGGYSIVFSTGVAIATYRRFWWITQTVFGGLFGGLGLSLIFAGVREIKVA